MSVSAVAVRQKLRTVLILRIAGFYHEQDVERAVNGHGLMLAYGDIADTARGKQAIGELVKAEFERQGFIVEWGGDEEQRLNLPGIMWQRRAE